MSPLGFIQDDLDLKLLVLYIMDRAAGPITFIQLFELALCDAGVDYFSLTQAVDHMVATGQLTCERERYAITDKGRRNSQICESSLPRSIRQHCDHNLIQMNEALRREAQIRTQITEEKSGAVNLCLALEDDTSPLFHLTLFSPTRAQAEQWERTFRADPYAIYLNLVKLLDNKKEDFHETK